MFPAFEKQQGRQDTWTAGQEGEDPGGGLGLGHEDLSQRTFLTVMQWNSTLLFEWEHVIYDSIIKGSVWL